MVEVFKTNIEQLTQSEILIYKIMKHMPNGVVNFDLEDLHKILRIEAESISIQIIIKLLEQHGFHAEVLI